MKLRHLVREADSMVTVGATPYHFKPNKHGHLVANVGDPEHAARLLARMVSAPHRKNETPKPPVPEFEAYDEPDEAEEGDDLDTDPDFFEEKTGSLPGMPQTETTEASNTPAANKLDAPPPAESPAPPPPDEPAAPTPAEVRAAAEKKYDDKTLDELRDVYRARFGKAAQPAAKWTTLVRHLVDDDLKKA